MISNGILTFIKKTDEYRWDVDLTGGRRRGGNGRDEEKEKIKEERSKGEYIINVELL